MPLPSLLDVPEPDVVAVHLLSAPVRLACPVLPGGAATRSARCAGPAPRRPAAAPPAARLPAGASGRKPPGTPAARRSPHRSSAAGHPRFRVLRPGWRRAGRERLAFPGAARPWVRDDGRSAPPAPSSPAPARPATADGGLGLRGNGKGGRAASAGARGLAGGLVLPEGKAGRTGRGIPDGGRRHTPAGRWPAGRAGLPPGTAGINPHLSPPGQVRPAQAGTGLTPGPEPRVDTARCPPRTNKGTAPGTGRPWAGHREGGTVARARAARATVALALRAARQPDEGVPACRQHAALPEGSVMGRVGPACRRFVRYYRNPVFRAFFHALPENRLVRDRHTRLAAAAILSRFARRSRSPALPLVYPGVGACCASPRCFIGPQSAGVSRRRHLAQVRDALDVLPRLPRVAQAQQPECCRVRRGCTQVHFLPDLQLSGSRGGLPPRAAGSQREPCANTAKPRVRRPVVQPVTAPPMSIRRMSGVPSKMVKIVDYGAVSSGQQPA